MAPDVMATGRENGILEGIFVPDQDLHLHPGGVAHLTGARAPPVGGVIEDIVSGSAHGLPPYVQLPPWCHAGDHRGELFCYCWLNIAVR